MIQENKADVGFGKIKKLKLSFSYDNEHILLDLARAFLTY